MVSRLNPSSSSTTNSGIAQASQLLDLPDEVKLLILSRLDAKDLQNSSLVCKNLRQISGDDSLWERLFKLDFPRNSDELLKTETPRAAYKSVYEYRYNRRILYSDPTQVMTLKGQERIFSHAYYDGDPSTIHVDDKIISSSGDGRITIVDVERGVCLHTIKPFYRTVERKGDDDGRAFSHTTTERRDIGVCSLAYAHGILFSAYEDGKIRMWDLKIGYQLIQTLETHHSRITSLIYVRGRLIAGHADGTINIWDFNPSKITPYKSNEKPIPDEAISSWDFNTINIGSSMGICRLF